MSERLTDEELAEIDARHLRHCWTCCNCENSVPCPPCDAARLLAEVRALAKVTSVNWLQKSQDTTGSWSGG